MEVERLRARLKRALSGGWMDESDVYTQTDEGSPTWPNPNAALVTASRTATPGSASGSAPRSRNGFELQAKVGGYDGFRCPLDPTTMHSRSPKLASRLHVLLR